MEDKNIEDVRRLIEQKTSKVSLRDLERKGFRKVKVLRSNDIDGLIRQAVLSVIGGGELSKDTQDELVDKSRRELKKIMAASQVVEQDRLRLQGHNEKLAMEADVLRGQLKQIEMEKRLLEELELPRLRERLHELEGNLKTERESGRQLAVQSQTDLKSVLGEVVRDAVANKGLGDIDLKQELARMQQTLVDAVARVGASSDAEISTDDVEAARLALREIFDREGAADVETNIDKVSLKQTTGRGVKSNLDKLKSLRKGGSSNR